MKTILATTLRLDEVSVLRLQKLFPVIQDLYCGVSIVTPPEPAAHLVQEVRKLPSVWLSVGRAPHENRRYLTIQQALQCEGATHIHYCDGDHVLPRMEHHLSAWQQDLNALSSADCLIIGRSAASFETYPPALRETEQIINRVGSYLLQQSVDLGAGARGFSRRAVAFLVTHASPDTHGIATDAEWPVLLFRAGFTIKTVFSDGAIYEIASEDQRQRLVSVEQWSKRVKLADQIIQAGLDAYGNREG